KLAITVHDISPLLTPEVYSPKDRLWHKVLNIPKMIKRADLIFAVSDFTKNDLIRHLDVPEHKIRVAYPGIDKNIFHPGLPDKRLREVSNVYGLPANFILFLNTIEPRKNLQTVISAFEKVELPLHLVVA